MTFKEVLGQVVEDGRVSYRALTRQFDLDDGYLDDLKEAILFCHSQARDEEGQGLVWAGEPSASLTGEQSETDGESLTHTSCAAKKNSSKTFSKCLLFSFAEAAVQPRK